MIEHEEMPFGNAHMMGRTSRITKGYVRFDDSCLREFCTLTSHPANPTTRFESVSGNGSPKVHSGGSYFRS
jgi:hypothetical protein